MGAYGWVGVAAKRPGPRLERFVARPRYGKSPPYCVTWSERGCAVDAMPSTTPDYRDAHDDAAFEHTRDGFVGVLAGL